MNSNGTTPYSDNDARTTSRGGSAAYSAALPSGAEPTPAAHYETDLIPHLRDKWGNRLPWFYSYSVPTVDDRELAETPLAETIERIREWKPLLADRLHHFYDRRLLVALRRLIAVRGDEEARLLNECERSERSHKEADAQTAAATADDRAALTDVEGHLGAAQRDAGRKAALTGGSYDPANPSDACVLRHERASLQGLAVLHRLPWMPADKGAGLHPAVSWAFTALVGAMIGASIGIMSRALIASDLTARPGALALFLFVGVAAAVFGKAGLFLSAREASQRYWLGYPVTNWGPFAVFAVILMFALLFIDSKVEQEGLMSGMRLAALAAELKGQTRGANAAQEWGYFFCAMIVTLGYVVTCAWQGYLHGRYDACGNRLLQEQEAGFLAEDAARRADPVVQDALDAIVRVRELLERQGFLLRRIATVTAFWDALRVPFPSGLDTDALKRIQDAIDKVEGAQTDFDRMLQEAIDDCDSGGGLLGGLRRAFRGGGPPRRTIRQPKRPVGK